MQLNINNLVSVTNIPGTSLTIQPSQPFRAEFVTISGPTGPIGPAGTGAGSAAGVSSLNGLTGILALNAINGSIIPSGSTIYISGYVPASTQVNGHTLTGSITILSSDIPVDHLPGANYSTLQQFLNTMNSPGLIQGAVMTDGGGGNLYVSAGTGMLRAADDNISSLAFVNVSPAVIPVPPDVVQYYVGFVYNNGSPIFELRAVNDWDNDTEIALGTVVNYFGQLVITNNPFLVGDPITNIIQRFDAMAPVTRDALIGGLILGELPTRYVTLSAGKLWTRLNDYEIIARNTAVGDVIYGASYNGVYWDYQTPLTLWPNTQYNDPALGLVTLSDGYFANLWFYCGVENGALGFIYGQAQWGNLTDASAEQAPAFLPANYTTTNVLVARLTFQKSATSSSLISSAFANTFTTSPATVHNSLGGLQGGQAAEYYHFSYQDFSNLTGLSTHLTVPSYLTLSGVNGATLGIGAGGSLGATAFTGLSGLNGLTGAVYINGAQGINISTSGNTLFVSGQDWALNGGLTQTGIILQSRIDSLSGFVGGVSGALQAQIVGGAGTAVKVTGSSTLVTANFTGVGGANVTISGANVYISGEVTKVQLDSLSGYAASAVNLVSSGQTLRALALGGDINLSGNLTTTGQSMYQMLTGTSGQAVIDYATKTSLTLSGQALQNFISGGDTNLSGNLTLTGQTLRNLALGGDTNLSGNLTLTGQTLRALTLGGDTNLSGNLTTTGQTLYQMMTGLSGQVNTNFATVTNLALTGSNLYVTLTGLSGQAVIDYATKTNLTVTGQTLFNLVIGGDANLSGNLTLTGQTLLAKITSLSGFVGGVSGALQAQIAGANGTAVKVTGSSTLTTADFTGIGSTLVFVSGSQVFISGTVGAAAGVSAINGLAGTIVIVGTGGLTASVVSQSIFISGDTSISGALTQTGVTLGAKIDSLSGWAASSTNLVLTGSNLYVTLTGMSGQAVTDYVLKTSLTTTGQTLYQMLTGTSGQAVTDYALKTSLTTTGQTLFNMVVGGDTNLSGNITLTGQTLYQMLTGASGQANINFATITNLALTGNNLYVAMTGLSGQANLNFATLTNLTLTGQTLRTFTLGGDTNLSGNLTTTGQTLYQMITGTSGQANTNFATITNLTTTGQTLFNMTMGGDTNLSGNLTLTGQTLFTKITSLSGFTVGVSGALQALIAGGGSVVKVSGSTAIATADFTGIGGTSVFISGGQVFISGAAAGAGGGVPSVNAITNAVTITATGGFQVQTIGSNITISGLPYAGDKQILFAAQNTLTGDSSLMWDSINDILTIGSGITISQYSIKNASGELNFSGMATNPIAGMFVSGWGNSLYGAALHSRRIKAISPQLTTTQQVWGDTAANLGTLSTLTTEAFGDVTQYTPAAGLSAGTSVTTASVYRGSQVGAGNGFFFVSKFLLNSPFGSGRAVGNYAEPSGSRIFVGLTDQALATQVGLNEPAGSMIGLNYLYASGGAVGTGQYMQNWAIRTRDNVATSTGTLAMSFQTGYYRFAMFCPPFPNNTIIYYQLDDILRGSGVKGSVTANLPVGSTALRSMAAIGFVSGLKPIGTSIVYTEIPQGGALG